MINRKRSLPKNWKIKKHHQRDGEIFFTIQYKSILGFWRYVRHYTGYEGETAITSYNSEEEAKEIVIKKITHYAESYGKNVIEVEEIKF